MLRVLPSSLLASVVGLGLVGVAACAAPEGDDVAESAGASSRAGASFAFEPGFERIRQHQADRQADWGDRTKKAKVDLLEDGKPNDRALSDAPALARQRAGFSLTNAKALARMALLAYEDEKSLAAELAALGLPSDPAHFRFFENRCTDAQAFYVTNAPDPTAPAKLGDAYNTASEHFAILAFRGTEPTKVKDLAADANTFSTPTKMGQMHAGFTRRVASLWDKADAKCGLAEPISSFLAARHAFDGTGRPVRKGAELYITGHSLGGAMANVALTRTVVDTCAAAGQTREEPCGRVYVPVTGLVTFGSPRVGDSSWANVMTGILEDRTTVYRFIHGRDVVTDVPLKPKFRHLGKDDDEAIFSVQITPSGSLAVGRDAERGPFSVGKAVGDHSMVQYDAELSALH